MTQLLAERRDIDFVLHEQMNTSEITSHEKYKTFNKKTIDLIINEARKLAIKELLPANSEGDKEGCTFENGKVTIPECYQRLYKLFKEGEWIALTPDVEEGGQGMPRMLSSSVSELFSVNTAFMMYPSLAFGAGELIAEFGTEKQKELYLKKMFAGVWGGTMDLTESNAGTDIGELTTSAKRNDDGTYSITGNKIFITAAEQDLTENVIHTVIARIEGAPKGVKGISLFVVPKIRVNDDGSLGEPNDIVVTGIEHKMGLNGSATCSVTFGGKGMCKGTLLGEENKGMNAMFKLMNSARLACGIGGLATSSIAYLYALGYARERIQGKHLLSAFDNDAPSVTIINHPDIRRVLMNMKAYVDGMRSFNYFLAKCFDKIEISEDDETKNRCKDLIDILTPITKAYCTDRAMDLSTMAVQCYGGAGYTKDYPVEQLMRDSKIFQIFEGANGIQAMDLLGRKMNMKNGRLFMTLLEEIQKTIDDAAKYPILEDLSQKLGEIVNKVPEVARKLGETAMSGEVLTSFSHAYPFLEVMGDIVMGWMHLWRGVVAVPKIEKLTGNLDPIDRREMAIKNKEIAFYEGILTSAEYFINVVLPITGGKINSISSISDSMIKMPDTSFGT